MPLIPLCLHALILYSGREQMGIGPEFLFSDGILDCNEYLDCLAMDSKLDCFLSGGAIKCRFYVKSTNQVAQRQRIFQFHNCNDFRVRGGLGANPVRGTISTNLCGFSNRETTVEIQLNRPRLLTNLLRFVVVLFLLLQLTSVAFRFTLHFINYLFGYMKTLCIFFIKHKRE